jgi:hypothetical protein
MPKPYTRSETSIAAERKVLRRALRDIGILLAVLLVGGVVVGWLTVGAPGVWGALIGVGLAGFFCATTVWSMLRTVNSSPTEMAALVLGAWLVKIVVVIAVLAALRGRDFYDALVLFAVVAIAALGSAMLDYRAIATGRIPYSDAA